MIDKTFIQIINFYDYFLNLYFDYQYGIKTCRKIPLHHLDIRSKNITYAKPYQGTNFRLLNQIFRKLSIKHENYNFIDLGSGLGRTLFVAANYPFKQIIGVEFAQNLVESSYQNLKLAQRKLKKDLNIKLVNEDILNFTPPEGPNIYFLFKFTIFSKLSQIIFA